MPERPNAAAGGRLAYLDWMRGFAVLVMIESHVFDSFMRRDLRDSSAYVLSQFVGGLAAPLFLFLAGMMVGFRMERRDEAGLGPRGRAWDVLKRAGYIMLIAELMLLQQWLFMWRYSAWTHLLRADILNCMAVAIAVTSIVALAPREKRPGAAIVLGAAIAAIAPVISVIDWSWAPQFLREYIVPAHGHFAIFPEAAYVPFGVVAAIAIRRSGEQQFEAMKWIGLAGLLLLYAGEFFSNQPYSLYAKSDFWVNSPGLIVIRTGIMALVIAFSFLWTRFGVLVEFVRQMGTTSLLIYWVHVELVYGAWLPWLKHHLTGAEAALATLAVAVAMYVLSVVKTRAAQRIRNKFRSPVSAKGADGIDDGGPLKAARQFAGSGHPRQ